MRVATYNIESFFLRPRALRGADRAVNRPILEAFASLNAILGKDAYSAEDKGRIVKHLDTLRVFTPDVKEKDRYATLCENHGRLVRVHKGGDVEVVAGGRGDWIGWVELIKDPVDELAIQHAAMVLNDVGADVQALVEVENRIALKQFSDDILPSVDGGTSFHQVMCIDGNDKRGIDVAIATADGYDLDSIHSHVDDADGDGHTIFSRDCPEYEVITPGRSHVLVLVNHLKSQGYGRKEDNDARRREQAERVAAIYRERRAQSFEYVAVLGDFNSTLHSDSLSPFDATDLRAAEEHPSFDDGGRKGTYKNCRDVEDLDHILLSPALYDAVEGGGIFRKGAWGGKNGDMWEHYDSLTAPIHAASDHCAVFVDVAVA